MSWISEIPSWLGTAILGTVFTVLGYVTNEVLNRWKEKKIAQSAKLSNLQELYALLITSNSLFNIQNEIRDRLYTMLIKNHKPNLPLIHTYDDLFSLLYDKFTPTESELHGIIRSITKNATQQVNQSMSIWLKNDQNFKTASVKTKNRTELATQLHNLEVHLTLWHAKYEYWIPENPKHALVYLGDKAAHGIPFPTGIEKIVEEAITELKKG